jgi:hypothetical protein
MKKSDSVKEFSNFQPSRPNPSHLALILIFWFPTLRPSARLERADSPNSAGKIFIIAMLAAKIREIDMNRHVRGLLGGRPVFKIIGNTAVSKITGSVGFQVAVHVCKFVS